MLQTVTMWEAAHKRPPTLGAPGFEFYCNMLTSANDVPIEMDVFPDFSLEHMVILHFQVSLPTYNHY